MRRLGLVALGLGLLLATYLVPTRSLWEWAAVETLALTLVPLLASWALGFGPGDLGLTLKEWRRSVRWAAIMLAAAAPVMLYASYLPEFRTYYPIWAPARESILHLFLLWALLLVLMLNVEFFFRGFLLFHLEPVAGHLAVVLQALPYALVHLGKPSLEIPYSLFVGIVFGLVALRTRSVLAPLITHWLGAVLFDALVLLGPKF
ncbi:MAG: CPBP family intramembrane metalloprotease [Euryarchaeota archaeon]|nr:CPBP family intramembrane metalloprotease [Euryarchaeota archaeon]